MMKLVVMEVTMVKVILTAKIMVMMKMLLTAMKASSGDWEWLESVLKWW